MSQKCIFSSSYLLFSSQNFLCLNAWANKSGCKPRTISRRKKCQNVLKEASFSKRRVTQRLRILSHKISYSSEDKLINSIIAKKFVFPTFFSFFGD